MRFVIAVAALFLAALPARALDGPEQQPFLRIEAGMHTAKILSISASADGRLLATGSVDKTARLWDVPSGKLLHIFRPPLGTGAVGEIHAVALSPDGRLLAVGGWLRRDDEHVAIYDTVTGALRYSPGGLLEVVDELQFSADGKWLAAGLGNQAGLRLWKATGDFSEQPFEDKDYGQRVKNVAFDGQGHVAVSSYDGKIRRYTLPTDKSPITLVPDRVVKAPNGDQPSGLAFSPNGKRLLLGYSDSDKLNIFDAKTLKLVQGAQPDVTGIDNGDIGATLWSDHPATIFAAGSFDNGDGTSPVIAWDKAGRAAPRALGGPTDTVLDLAMLPDGGVAWSSGEPSIGAFAKDDSEIFRNQMVMADMRGKRGDSFLVSADTTTVRFGLKQTAEDPWTFDLASLTVEAAPEAPKDFHVPQIEGLKVEDWINSDVPTLDKQVLKLDSFETSRSLVIAPDAKSFFIGTEWAIRQFGADGQQIMSITTPGIAWGLNLSADGQVLVAAVGDGTLRWYRTSDGQELLAFFLHVPDKRWIAWTPSGYYTASPGGEDLFGWQINGQTWEDPVDFFPASRFRDTHYRPDVVQLILATRDEDQALTQANAKGMRKDDEKFNREELPPIVEIIADPRGLEATEPTLELHYNVRSPSGKPISRVEARVDGALVLSVNPRGVSDPSADDGSQVIDIPLPAHDVTITLVAFQGDQPGPPASVGVKWTGKAESTNKPRLQALLVGISKYDDKRLTLHWADKDASDLAEALRAQGGHLYAPDPTITVLQNHDASANAVVRALKALREAADDNTYTVVFIAGHGRTDATNDFFFLPATASLDDEPEVGSVSGDTIYRQLGQIKGKVVLLVDACHAANGIQGSAVDMTAFISRVTGEQNSIMMYASSAGRELSLESNRWENGAFTEALLTILNTPEDYGDDGVLFTPELEQALYVEVRALTNAAQTAVANKSGAVPPFPVAQLK